MEFWFDSKGPAFRPLPWGKKSVPTHKLFAFLSRVDNDAFRRVAYNDHIVVFTQVNKPEINHDYEWDIPIHSTLDIMGATAVPPCGKTLFPGIKNHIQRNRTADVFSKDCPCDFIRGFLFAIEIEYSWKRCRTALVGKLGIERHIFHLSGSGGSRKRGRCAIGANCASY